MHFLIGYTRFCWLGIDLPYTVLIHINSVALERMVRGTLAELSKNLMISLLLRNN